MIFLIFFPILSFVFIINFTVFNISSNITYLECVFIIHQQLFPLQICFHILFSVINISLFSSFQILLLTCKTINIFMTLTFMFLIILKTTFTFQYLEDIILIHHLKSYHIHFFIKLFLHQFYHFLHNFFMLINPCFLFLRFYVLLIFSSISRQSLLFKNNSWSRRI